MRLQFNQKKKREREKKKKKRKKKKKKKEKKKRGFFEFQYVCRKQTNIHALFKWRRLLYQIYPVREFFAFCIYLQEPNSYCEQFSTERCQNSVSSFAVANRSAGSFTFDSMNIKFLFTCTEIHIQLSFTCIVNVIWLVYLWQYQQSSFV